MSDEIHTKHKNISTQFVEEDGLLIPNGGYMSETNVHRQLFRQFSYQSNYSSDTRNSSQQNVAVFS